MPARPPRQQPAPMRTRPRFTRASTRRSRGPNSPRRWRRSISRPHGKRSTPCRRAERTSLVVVDGAMGEGTAFHIYAHEFSHVVDGPERLGKAISSTPGWRVAWDTEINTVAADGGRPITAYATWGPIEGFAEYGRMVLMHPKAAREDFPESWAVWKAHGLV